jgi:hypothetical protein
MIQLNFRGECAMQEKFEIRFENVDPRQGNELAQELEDLLADQVPDVDVTRVKDRSDTLDFGATLVLVLGAPVSIILAKALKDFLTRNSGVTLEFTKDGAIIARNLSSEDVPKAIEQAVKRHGSISPSPEEPSPSERSVESQSSIKPTT